MSSRIIRILLVGPLPPPMGGNTRHFAILVEDLAGDEAFSVKLINTSRGEETSRPVRNLLVAMKTLLTVMANLHHVDIVSYHASNRGLLQFGPFIVGMGKLTRTPTMLRVFGGSFGDCYEKQNRIRKAITRKLLLTADVVLLQTHRAMNQLQGPATARLEWFSTYIKSGTRPSSQAADEHRDRNRACTRFIFLGHLWRAKGLETMLEAAPRLPDECSIDVYGPLDEYTADDIRNRGAGRIRYCGFLTHDEVDARLWEYDCLVLPTFYSNEGYPGAIPEAFVHGLPVITTRWLAIPEIVDESCGILIEPGNTQEFVGAITALYQDNARWLKLKDGARTRAKQFDHALWARKFAEICEHLVKK